MNFPLTPTASPPPTPRPMVWTIAGTDSGAGAGIHADARAFEAFAVHGACAVAAVTAQNSLAVHQVAPVAAQVLDAQLAALAQDMPPAAIKTGLLGSVENLRVVADWVRRLRARTPERPVALVVDPVWGATTGALFADEVLRAAYRDELLPLATLATPNLAEAAALAGLPGLAEPAQLAAAWRRFGTQAVVVTGGDMTSNQTPHTHASWASDFLDSQYVQGEFKLPRIATPHNHGTGCVFAASAAAALAHGFADAEAVVLAKMATTEALRYGYAAGAGAGPVAPQHGFALRGANLPMLSPISANNAGLQPPFPALRAMPPLYAIVDSAAWVARVLKAGVRLVQLRIKDAPADALVREIRAAIAHARAAGAQLFVNDHWQLAMELGASGVHLGQDDLARTSSADLASLRNAGLYLGLSTHCYWEVCRARTLQPSYIACGPVYPTLLKQMPWHPQGPDNLAYWCQLLAGTPVVAIGGMDAPRARNAMACGAASVAMVGAITRSPSPERAIAALNAALIAGAHDRRTQPAAVLPPWARPTI